MSASVPLGANDYEQPRFDVSSSGEEDGGSHVGGEGSAEALIHIHELLRLAAINFDVAPTVLESCHNRCFKPHRI